MQNRSRKCRCKKAPQSRLKGRADSSRDRSKQQFARWSDSAGRVKSCYWHWVDPAHCRRIVRFGDRGSCGIKVIAQANCVAISRAIAARREPTTASGKRNPTRPRWRPPIRKNKSPDWEGELLVTLGVVVPVPLVLQFLVAVSSGEQLGCPVTSQT